MNTDRIHISKILKNATSSNHTDYYTVCWIKDEVEAIEINDATYTNIDNSVFFLHPTFTWKIIGKKSVHSSGYILSLPKEVLAHPIFKNLHITEIYLFNATEIPQIKLAPGIETRIQSILEMLDEFISTNLKNKEQAILSLLNTFFVYCDGKCNIKQVITDNNSKSSIVYRFKKLIDQHITAYHQVGDYANLLNISDKYLNECVKDVLDVNAKRLIDEILIMRSRYQLKFTDHTVKEIGFGLGFTSSDYFSSFFKKHTGTTPSQLRKS